MTNLGQNRFFTEVLKAVAKLLCSALTSDTESFKCFGPGSNTFFRVQKKSYSSRIELVAVDCFHLAHLINIIVNTAVKIYGVFPDDISLRKHIWGE